MKSVLLCFLGEFAFLLESPFNEYATRNIACNTMRVGESIDVIGYGIATPLRSDLREAMNMAVLELSEIGYLQQLKLKWFYEQDSTCNVETSTQDSKWIIRLSMTEMAVIFYILIIGLGLGMLIAFFEFLLKAKRDSTSLNQNICKVIRRNLRISIMGRSIKQNARSPTMAVAMKSTKNNNEAIVNESNTLNVEHTSQLS